MPKKIRIATIVGARPQFIKAAVISRAIRKHNESISHHDSQTTIHEILIHTGQHYDYEMSQVFFDQLDIPKPNYHLEIGSGSHGNQTGRMMMRIEEVLIKEKPDWVLIYGDTNSTLAGALVASKLHIPIAHAEAGLRSYNRQMPEEINRVVADHLSTLLFAPTSTAVKNLKKEGITAGVHETHDLMEEALAQSLETSQNNSTILQEHNLKTGDYYLATVHRSENTDDVQKLNSILDAFSRITNTLPLVWPIHPRTRKIIDGNNTLKQKTENIKLVPPVSYIDMLTLESNARVILTDSGGVQKEAFWLGVPCITLREETEWVETVTAGMNHLSGTSCAEIISTFKKINALENKYKQNILKSTNSGMFHIKFILGASR